ncbi:MULTISPECIES: hypothetical protein [unclassified Crossiella]|uniref:hypothetical protein n=1 Tax=unclassified Crossiella TaxID=2620835 RepID=UPI001FFF0E4D|nr:MULTISPECIES: hypothetical protein [unclassified Crossiella]MCK2242051.1 hypothetical protein [Crossiella sp. S99.2]MCK2255954.1 hypothetical protein [Crossiella sp. S99.1]
MTRPSPLQLIVWSRHHLAVVQPVGRLDLSSQQRLLDGLFKVAATEPAALVVILDKLELGSPSSLGIFHRVWRQVNVWPDIPMALVAEDPELQQAIAAGRLARLLPVCPTLTEAVRVCRSPPSVRQRQMHLPCGDISGLRARLFVTEACLDWGQHEPLGDALLIVQELVSAAVAEGGPELWVRVRLRDIRLTLSVRDRTPDALTQTPPVLGQLALAHGRTPSPGGGVSWAVLRGQ